MESIGERASTGIQGRVVALLDIFEVRLLNPEVVGLKRNMGPSTYPLFCRLLVRL